MNTIQEKIKQKEFEKKRKQLLIDTINDILKEDISQLDIAEVLGVTPSTLSRLKNDKLPVSPEKVEEYLIKFE